MYRALLVCNAAYTADPLHFPELLGPRTDRRILSDALSDGVTGMFEPEFVKVLRDATTREMSEQIHDFLRSAEKDDVVLLYFSGHAELYNRALYLCGTDSRRDRLVSSALLNIQLSVMIDESLAVSTIIILDCCYSGSFKGTPDDTATLLSGRGRFVITATLERELADDAAEDGMPSPFTRRLVDGLLHAAVDENGDGYIDMNELYTYLSSSAHKGPQPGHKFAGAGRVLVAKRPKLEPTTEEPSVTPERSREPSANGVNEPVSLPLLERTTTATPVEPRKVSEFRTSLREDVARRIPAELDDDAFLTRANLLRGGVPTVTAVLLFGQEPTAAVPTAKVQCTRYFGVDKIARRRMVDFTGSLPEQLAAAYEFVSGYADRGESPVEGSVVSQPEFAYPMTAVREIIANALIHRDYEHQNTCIHVRFFDDRVEVTSPGTWPGVDFRNGQRKTIGKLAGESLRRNFRLADVMTWARIVEGEGSGIPTAVQDCAESDAPEPVVVQHDQLVTVTIRPRHLPDSDENATGFAAKLRRLRREAGMTQEQLAEASGVAVRTIRRMEIDQLANPRTATVDYLARGLAPALGSVYEDIRRELLGDPSVILFTDGSSSSDMPLRGAIAEAVEMLAREVRRRWIREEEQRRVHDPYPLPVRWRSASADLFESPTDIRVTLPDSASSSQPTTTGNLPEIADAYSRIASGRLVVLGHAGSGKTVLITRLVMDLLNRWSPGRPVPVIYSVGSWDPAGTALRDWLIDCLVRDHPQLVALVPGGSTLAAALVDDGGILPVLDGFDEIAAGLNHLALEQLSATPMPFVLTSRTEQFAEAVHAGRGVTRAAVLELSDLTPADLADYLPRTASSTVRDPRDGTATTAWDSVLTLMREQPENPAYVNLATVLSTPMMLFLARTAYSDKPDANPAVLLDTERFPTPQALEDHLLSEYVPAVYRSPRQHTSDPQRAQRYLGYLAEHLGRIRQRDLAWWRLGSSLRPLLQVLAVVVACTVIAAVTDSLGFLLLDALGFPGTAHGLRAGLSEPALVGPAVGLSFGLGYGLQKAFGRPDPEPSRVRLPRLRYRALDGRSVTIQGSRIMPAIGLVGGLVMGIMIGLVSALVPGLSYVLRTDGGPVTEALLNALVYGLVFGLGAGVALGLTAVLEVPVDVHSAATPASVLASSRASAIRQILTIAPLLAISIAYGGLLVTNILRALLGPVSWPMAHGFAIGIVGGLTGALCYALTFTAWGQWMLFTRIVLPITGRLPWAITDFLDDANRRGVLRQAGACYQFRYARLQSHLSDASSIEQK